MKTTSGDWGVIDCTNGYHVWDHLGCEIEVGKGKKNLTKARKLANYLNRNNINGKTCNMYLIMRSGGFLKETKKLRLTLDIEYYPNGVSVKTLKSMLEQIAHNAAGQGLMTGETAAEVETWSAKVEEVNE